MKKTVLAVLMVVMIATPCLAQEIETDGLFSIDGTKWQMLPTGLGIFPLPVFYVTDGMQFGFYGGKVYPNLQTVEISFYIDMLAFSIFFSMDTPSITTQAGGGGGRSLFFGIMQPIGIGMVVEVYECGSCAPTLLPFSRISIAMLTKTEDTWTQPEEPEVE